MRYLTIKVASLLEAHVVLSEREKEGWELESIKSERGEYSVNLIKEDTLLLG